MKRLFLILSLALLLCLALTVMVSAKDVYLEEIPEELKAPNDTATHFVVFEEEKYYTGSGNTISGLNTAQMNDDMAAANIDSSKIGSTYLTRFNVPSHLNGTLVTYVNLNSMKSNGYFWGKCGYIQLAGTVTKTHDMNQSTSQLRCFDFGENSQLTEIPYCFASNSTRLYDVKNFPRNLNVINKDAFNSCYNAFRGELYLNAKRIEDNAFNNALGHLEGLTLGPSVEFIGRQTLCVRLSEVPNGSRPENDILPLNYIEFQCDVSKVTFATQGNDTGSFYFIGTTRSPYSMLKCIILSNPNNAKDIKEGSVFNDFTAEGVNILFNDSNGLDDYVTASHGYIDSGIVYESFLKSGTKQTVCTNCGNVKGEAVSAIFENLGFSVMDFGNTPAFTIGYMLNREALTTYEKATGNTVSYGILMVASNNLGSNMPLDENGNATSLENGSVVVAILNRACEYFDGMVKGFATEEQKNAQIIACAFAIVKNSQGSVTLIDYLQDKSPSGSLSSTSYNDLIQQ